MNWVKNTDWIEFGIGPELLPIGHLSFNAAATFAKKDFVLSPVKILTTKDETELFYRTFSFVDKKELQDLNVVLNNNKNIIGSFLSRVNDDKISQYQICELDSNGDFQFVNLIELKSINKNSRNSFRKNLFDEIERSSIFKHSHNIDVAKFYDSVYTHSLEWIDDVNINKIAKDLDTKSQNINGKMTNGIPTGPISSKIISEILLTEIMLRLRSKIDNIDCHIHRFADDFTIYFNKEEDFVTISKHLAAILNFFKLSINKEKLDSNYTFQKDILKNVTIYDDGEKWEVVFEEIMMNFSGKSEAIYKVKSLIANSIKSLASSKEKTSFYKWILKTWNNDHVLKIVESDEELLSLILNFAINYIVISDLGLNIPFLYLQSISKMKNDVIKNKYLNRLARIYSTTNSEMKKIFIYDFLYKMDEIKLIEKFIDAEVLFNKNQLLHISQLLETKRIKTSQVLLTQPTMIHKRLSDNWVIWMYASSSEIATIADADAKKAIVCLLGEKDKYKPFTY